MCETVCPSCRGIVLSRTKRWGHRDALISGVQVAFEGMPNSFCQWWHWGSSIWIVSTSPHDWWFAVACWCSGQGRFFHPVRACTTLGAGAQVEGNQFLPSHSQTAVKTYCFFECHHQLALSSRFAESQTWMFRCHRNNNDLWNCDSKAFWWRETGL